MVEIELDSIDMFRIQGWYQRMCKNFKPSKNDVALINKVNVLYDELLKEEFDEEDWEEDDEKRKKDDDDDFDDDPRPGEIPPYKPKSR